MAWKPDYVLEADLQTWMVREGGTFDSFDSDIASWAITAASRAIDYWCGRQFGSGTQTRYYTADSSSCIDGRWAVKIDDIQTTVGMVIAYDSNDDQLWSQATTTVDWSLWPYNAPADGVPYTHLLQGNNYLYGFPWVSQGIKVTATFGWTAVPAVVTQACLLQAARYFVRRDSPYGEAGSPTIGNQSTMRLDDDVKQLLWTVKKKWGAC